MKREFHEATYTVRLLCDRHPGKVSGPEDLAAVIRAAVVGEFVGELVAENVREISPLHMAEALKKAGSEPGFFNLPDLETAVAELMESHSQEGCAGDLTVVDYVKLLAVACAFDDNEEGGGQCFIS
jgi:hypothetical protein